MTKDERILRVILGAIEQLNHARVDGQKLAVSPDAEIFGGSSPLDSLGLVALVIDIEEALADQGLAVSLSDEKTMSQRNSPFRSVASLAEFIEQKVATGHVE
jgi:acyl carrier protein